MPNALSVNKLADMKKIMKEQKKKEGRNDELRKSKERTDELR